MPEAAETLARCVASLGRDRLERIGRSPGRRVAVEIGGLRFKLAQKDAGSENSPEVFSLTSDKIELEIYILPTICDDCGSYLHAGLVRWDGDVSLPPDAIITLDSSVYHGFAQCTLVPTPASPPTSSSVSTPPSPPTARRRVAAKK